MDKIKKTLIERIKSTDNPQLLQEIYALLEAEQKGEIIFSEEHKNLLQEREEEYKRGMYISNDQLKKDMDEWLK